MQRSNKEDSGGWQRYWYERTGVPQVAQSRRSPSWTVSQVPTLSHRPLSPRALHIVMPTILPHDSTRVVPAPHTAALGGAAAFLRSAHAHPSADSA